MSGRQDGPRGCAHSRTLGCEKVLSASDLAAERDDHAQRRSRLFLAYDVQRRGRRRSVDAFPLAALRSEGNTLQAEW